MKSNDDKLRILILADNCSLRYGGEAAIPFQYFRFLRLRGVEAFLLVHGRNREELYRAFPGDIERLFFVHDDPLHRFLHHLGRHLPNRVQRATFGFVSLIYTQFRQRRIAWRLVRDKAIDVIHQPTPVSPATPSLIFDIGAAVVMGPMNGGMNYPPGFRGRESAAERIAVTIGRRLRGVMNWLLPGKRRAGLLLVANDRTRDLLPRHTRAQIMHLPENGAELPLWHLPSHRAQQDDRPVRFVYMGRLVDWKGVDLLLAAWARVHRDLRAALHIIGDGLLRCRLQTACRQMGLDGSVEFTGWLSQEQCSQRLAEADVLVLASLMECGGAVVLEAMAAGLPVIASAWGGPSDYIDPSCGILVPPVSQEQLIAGLAEAMRQLCHSPELRRRMGEAGQRKVREQFDWSQKVRRMLALYRQALCRSDPSLRPSSPRTASPALEVSRPVE